MVLLSSVGLKLTELIKTDIKETTQYHSESYERLRGEGNT